MLTAFLFTLLLSFPSGIFTGYVRQDFAISIEFHSDGTFRLKSKTIYFDGEYSPISNNNYKLVLFPKDNPLDEIGSGFLHTDTLYIHIISNSVISIKGGSIIKSTRMTNNPRKANYYKKIAPKLRHMPGVKGFLIDLRRFNPFVYRRIIDNYYLEFNNKDRYLVHSKKKFRYEPLIPNSQTLTGASRGHLFDQIVTNVEYDKTWLFVKTNNWSDSVKRFYIINRDSATILHEYYSFDCFISACDSLMVINASIKDWNKED